ncbi:MAG: thioredoxin domain-containing protein [Archangium sp.]
MFEKLTLEEATTKANAAHKYLLIDFTAKWCGPCAKMDRTTWSEPLVHDWVREHAIAIQLDSDENEALCREWDIKTLPSVLIRRDGAELDRVRGYQSALQLVPWLDGVRAGKTRLDALRLTGDTDVNGRFRLAQELVDRGQFDEAVGHFAWLWEHSLEHEPAWLGVRSSFMIGALEPLVKSHAPARERFESLRAIADFGDWVTLSVLLEHEDEIVARIEKMTPDEAEQVGLFDEPHVVEVLDAHSALASYGKLLPNPKQRLADEKSRLKAMLEEDLPPELRAEVEADLKEMIEKTQDAFARALEEAGRAEEADAVRDFDVRLGP